jgi:hypothetical protein
LAILRGRIAGTLTAMKTSELSQNGNSTNLQHWFNSGHGDIARLIERTIMPYVDHGNVSLQHDELRDECWLRVAKLLSGSSLSRCQTRQQFFAFIKVSLKNHIYSLVHKHAFTMKRTGLPVPPKAKFGARIDYRKTGYVRLDDPNESLELETDDSATQFDALVSDFADLLSPSERLMLRDMIASADECDTQSAASLRTRYKEFLRS